MKTSRTSSILSQRRRLYTVFWIGMLVVELGLIVVTAGIGVALAKGRDT